MLWELRPGKWERPLDEASAARMQAEEKLGSHRKALGLKGGLEDPKQRTAGMKFRSCG